ncbi:MAG: polyprenyl synthetase family protein [Pseudomonadales bacterium]|nr:polyprenyl synthetase family protein [Pseudomonadales bacterium]
MSEQVLENQHAALPKRIDSIEDVYKLVENDFNAVNCMIPKQLTSDINLVEEIGQYITESGGKRLRPLLVLLSAKSLNYSGEDHIILATVIEFLHTATLLHDDVVDKSFLRRGKATANSLWGDSSSILVGDFLYSRAFQMMVELKNMEIMSVLSQATNIIAEGEVAQLSRIGDVNLSEQDYFQVIQAKTAMLFKAASHTGAILSTSDASCIKALENYGMSLGLAYQLVDDWLDYAGDQELMGKNIGDDLAEGKMTLPLIHAVKQGSERVVQLIADAIEKPSHDNIQHILQLVKNSGALEYTKAQAESYAKKAINHLSTLPDSVYKQALTTLARFSISRFA